MIPLLASLKIVTLERGNSSPNCWAVNAALDPTTWLDKDPVTSGSGSAGIYREHGAVHHLPVALRIPEHVEFWPVYSLKTAALLPIVSQITDPARL